MSLSVQLIDSMEGLKTLQDSWRRLDQQVPFRSFEWVTTWWKHYGQAVERRQLHVVVIRNDEQLGSEQVLAIAPWYIELSRTRGRIVRWLGSGEVCSDHPTILCKDKDRMAVVDALARHLLQSEDWNRLVLEAIDEQDELMAEFSERMAAAGCSVSRQSEGNCWCIQLPDNWEDYLATLSKSHRKQIRRADRSTLGTERAKWRLVKSAEQLNVEWPLFVDLHQRRRQSLGEPGCFASRQFAAFHREVAERFLALDKLRLSFLDLDGHPVAVEYQFAGGGRLFAYQGGFDPNLLDQEPGRLSLIATLKSAIDQGFKEIDFLRGDEPYKAHWRATANPTYRLKILAPSHHRNWLAQSVDLAESLTKSVKSRLRPLVQSLDNRFGFSGS